MAEEQPGQEKTEEPTPKRLQEARRKGQVPRSKELNTLLTLLMSALALLFFGGAWLDSLRLVFSDALQVERGQLLTTASMASQLGDISLRAFAAIAPFLTVTLLAAFMGPLVMGGWAFSASAIAFKLEKINPVKGLGRVFSLKGLMELLKTLAKFLLLAFVTLLLFRLFHRELLVLAQYTPGAAMQSAIAVLLWSFLALSATMLLVAAIDVPFERWNHQRQLRMTRQEVRDELKETDGRPEVKQRIKTMQREAAQRRMMQDVPKADVVITNPTHYAVALRYQPEGTGAPEVLAKGRDLMAARIRECARENGVAIFSAPPLARALYASTEIGDEIPRGLYLAVARVLAYVFQLRSAGPTDYVPQPDDIEVPPEYRDDNGEESSDGR